MDSYDGAIATKRIETMMQVLSTGQPRASPNVRKTKHLSCYNSIYYDLVDLEAYIDVRSFYSA